MKNSSYYIAPVGDWTQYLPHTIASNMVKVSHTLNHSATEADKLEYAADHNNSIRRKSRGLCKDYYRCPLHVYMGDVWVVIYVKYST